jgi:cobalt-zinc-cadmium efflux system outer membrane protein
LWRFVSTKGFGMRPFLTGAYALVLAAQLSGQAPAARTWSWTEVRDRFETTNQTLQAARLAVEESRQQQITAYLRPNPDLNLSTDGTQLSPYNGVWKPFAGTQISTGLSYLHERGGKRELRRDSAQQTTEITASQLADQERTLLFNLRNAFVQMLQQKAVLALARENLAYWNQVLEVSRNRFQAGDLSRADLNKLEVQKVQYDSDLVTATTNLRTAKIQLLALLNDRTPVEQFDVSGPFDFPDSVAPLEEFRMMALENRPDLKAAVQSVDLARINHRLAFANGSSDPTISGWWTHNPSFNNPFDNNTVGVSISFPLRIFDKNQGEKARTEIDITRSERLRDANETQVYSDVDSAYANIQSNLTLLGSYKTTYLQLAGQVRDTEMFAYQNGGASLLDFLQAQQDYRTVQLSYLNLIGSYMTAAGQMSLAVGKEVTP